MLARPLAPAAPARKADTDRKDHPPRPGTSATALLPGRAQHARKQQRRGQVARPPPCTRPTRTAPVTTTSHKPSRDALRALKSPVGAIAHTPVRARAPLSACGSSRRAMMGTGLCDAKWQNLNRARTWSLSGPLSCDDTPVSKRGQHDQNRSLRKHRQAGDGHPRTRPRPRTGPGNSDDKEWRPARPPPAPTSRRIPRPSLARRTRIAPSGHSLSPGWPSGRDILAWSASPCSGTR